SREAVQQLHEQGISVVMITGDAEGVAQSVAQELGIDEVFAQVRPQDKSARVQDLQQRGRTVAMVGDGVNDAPALAQADVGIAIGAGTDVAAASAGVILAGNDPRSVLAILRLSHASYRTMRQNLWWASGYNLIAVPLAAGVLAPIGFVMPMAVGALLMSASTVVVALNALRLRSLDLQPADAACGGRSSRPLVAPHPAHHHMRTCERPPAVSPPRTLPTAAPTAPNAVFGGGIRDSSAQFSVRCRWGRTTWRSRRVGRRRALAGR